MRRLFFPASCFGIVLLLSASAWSQAPAPPPPPAEQDAEPTIRIDVDLVNIFFTVKAKKGGQLIPNLEQKNFTVFEDAKQQTIQHFSKESDLPLTLGLLIDISASQERLIDTERQAASQFFASVIRKKDEAFVISFGKETQLLQDYTSSARQLTASMNDLQGDGQSVGFGPIPNAGPIPQSGDPKGTLLYDAVYLAANEKLKSEVGRKAIILITDGGDQGSTYKIQDAIEQAQRSDAIIYSIYYVDRQFYSQSVFGGGGEGNLEKMSQQTGGHVFRVDKKHTLQDIFKEIQDELRNQYSIGYKPLQAAGDGTFRKIDIRVDTPENRVQARSGYYATKNDVR